MSGTHNAPQTTVPVTTHTPSEMCVRCGYLFDAASGIPGNEKNAPKEGDISICLNCAHATVFGADLRKRPLTEAERLELPRELRQQLRQAKRHCMLAQGVNLATRGGTS